MLYYTESHLINFLWLSRIRVELDINIYSIRMQGKNVNKRLITKFWLIYIGNNNFILQYITPICFHEKIHIMPSKPPFLVLFY